MVTKLRESALGARIVRAAYINQPHNALIDHQPKLCQLYSICDVSKVARVVRVFLHPLDSIFEQARLGVQHLQVDSTSSAQVSSFLERPRIPLTSTARLI